MAEYKRREPHENILFKIVQEHYASFASRYHNYPKFVYKAFDGFIECGDLSRGFMRTKCPDCDEELITAFSCKLRGFCASCGAKRASETASHLVDNILPMTRYRQVVITLPFSLRFWCATNRELLTRVHNIIKASLQKRLVSKAISAGIRKPAIGFISFIHNWSSSLSLNPHLHILVMDATFESGDNEHPRLLGLGKWNISDLEQILNEIIKKTISYLRKKGYLDEREEVVEPPPLDSLFQEHGDLTNSLHASLHNLVAFGPDTGQKVHRIGRGFGYKEELALYKGKLCISKNGFNIHAGRVIKTLDRNRLFDLVGYMARPAISTKRLSITEGGNIRYELKRQWSDGTRAVEFSPMDFLSRLAALVPPPRMNMIKYVGIFSPNHPLRKKVLLKPKVKKASVFKHDDNEPSESGRRKVKNGSWAKLLSRVFSCDVGHCSKCGGEMEIMSAVFDPAEVKRYLTHVGEARPLPKAGMLPLEEFMSYHPIDQ